MRQPTSIPVIVLILICALFFLSGVAGLVYQVLWMRSLGLFFGSDMYGVAIILSTFMGGLALGSFFGGQVAERVERPLVWYGLAEIGIGVFALSVPSILETFEPLLQFVYPASFTATSGFYHAARVLLAAGALLVPTTLMGATLPLILRHFVRSSSTLGETAALFYGVNTLGALAGTIAAGFVLLPHQGMYVTTLYVAALNLAVGAGCLLIGTRTAPPARVRLRSQREDRSFDSLPEFDAASRSQIARAALIGIAISGAGAFALEVVWTRILIMSFSATVYSFASMLACFLFGIFFGSLLIARFVDEIKDPLALLARLELGVGLVVGSLCLLVNAIPGFFGGVLGVAMQLFPGSEGGALLASTLTASFFLLLVPTTLLGATFSVALRAYTVNSARIGTRTGNLYFANTAGAIIGSLGAALFLLPNAGAAGGLAMIAAVFCVNGIYLLGARPGARARSLLRPATILPVALTMLALGAGLAIPYRITLNFNQGTGSDVDLLFHREGVQNTIDIIRSKSNVTSLVIGGNIEADDGYTQRRHFVLKGHLPLMFLEDPRSVLVIGLGMGITLQATAHHPGVERIDVVELSPDILAAHAHLRDINANVVQDPRVRVRIDDGRSFMKLGSVKYDMITADPIHPKVSRVGYLYTREYYESLRDRLNEGGIVCQWMPIYQIAPTRLRSAIKTFLEVFPHATVWYVKNHALLVAKRDASLINFRLLQRKFWDSSVREDMESINVKSPEEFLALLLMSPQDIREFVNEEPATPVNTDDHPYLEYFTPGDLFYQPIQNVRELVRHTSDPTRLIENQPAESAALVRSLVRNREQLLVEELVRNPS